MDTALSPVSNGAAGVASIFHVKIKSEKLFTSNFAVTLLLLTDNL